MQLSLQNAFFWTIAMSATIFFCRVFPFIFFSHKKSGITHNTKKEMFLSFIEKTAPPVAMTVLTFNQITKAIYKIFKDNNNASIIFFGDSLLNSLFLSVPVIAASVITALLHIWKKNPLLSIFSGTVSYMILTYIIV
ncbi:MAG: AzlD domain-containing protein [Spirochaetaceae bacterium]|nr:AzlD domain-containing protein [Spirochaetaceae bacterium]